MEDNQLIMQLSKASLTGKYNKEIFEAVDEKQWSRLYALAKQHSITSLTFHIASSFIMESQPELYADWKKSYEQTLVKELSFDAQRDAILSEFEACGIKYLPLKGIIINKLYPESGLREFSDNDILYDASRQKDVIQIMTSQGFYVDKIAGKDDIFMKEPIYNFEMHRQLIDYNYPYYDYYLKVWDRALKDSDNGFGYHMTDEDFYIYFLVHMNKHFANAGTGIRSINDAYVIRNFLAARSVNRRYIDEQLKLLELSEFEQQINEVLDYLFCDGIYNERTGQTLNYIVSSGIYGTLEHSIDNSLQKRGSFVYVLSRLFPPVHVIRQWNSMVDKHPWTLPLVWIYRPFLLIFSKQRRMKVALELKKLTQKHPKQ